MSYVYEEISPEDLEKYDFSSTPNPRSPKKTGCNPHQWAIERESGTFLFLALTGREEFANEHSFVYWWSGRPVGINLTQKITKNTILWKWGAISYPRGESFPDRVQMIEQLKQALRVFGFGYSPTLSIQPEDVLFDF